jgi:hypothetical protein
MWKKKYAFRKPGQKKKKNHCKRPTGRPRHRWENDIKMDPKGLDATVSMRSIWLRKGTHGTHELGNDSSGSRGVENFLTIMELPAYEDRPCSM